MDLRHRCDVVVVAGRADAAAAALVALLRRRGRRAMLVDESAIVAATLEHRPASGPVDPDHRGIAALPGDVLRLANGYPIGSATGLLVWRLDGFPVPRLPAEHREYAECEGFAAGLSWLAGLGDVVLNRPDPLGLAGARVDPLALHRLATACGLAVPRFGLRTNDAAAGAPPSDFVTLEWEVPGLPELVAPGAASEGPRLPRPAFSVEPVVPQRPVLVLDGEVRATAHDAQVQSAPALAALAGQAGLRCAELGLGRNRAGRLVVTGVSPVPSLRQPGHLAAFADYIERRAGSRAEGVAA